MTRREAQDARHAGCRPVLVDPGWRFKCCRGGRTDAWMIVIEHEHAGVIRVLLARHARVARTEITARFVRPKLATRITDCFSLPRAIVSVRRNDDPFTP